MKLTLIIIIILLAASLSAEIQPDKLVHFSFNVGAWILCDVLEISPIAPLVFCVSCSLIKELTDKRFSWEDLGYDGAGIFVGFGIRFADRRQR